MHGNGSSHTGEYRRGRAECEFAGRAGSQFEVASGVGAGGEPRHKGPEGPTGAQGVSPAGSPGLPGVAGAAGPQGTTGPQGIVGNDGAQGLPGDEGIQAPTPLTVAGGRRQPPRPATVPTQSPTAPIDGALIVKSGSLDLQVPHEALRPTFNRITTTVVGLGGYIANQTANYNGGDPTGIIWYACR